MARKFVELLDRMSAERRVRIAGRTREHLLRLDDPHPRSASTSDSSGGERSDAERGEDRSFPIRFGS